MRSFLPIILCMLVASCGRGPATPKQAADLLQTAFAGAEPRIKTNIDAAAAALTRKDYGTAFFLLEAVKGEPTLTVDQIGALQVSMGRIQHDIGEAVVRGDTNALQNIHLMRGP